MRSWLALFAGTSAALISVVANAAGVPSEYTVQDGDTCAAIAQKFYGDSRRVDLIHDANPSWGPAPHALKPGQIVKLSPKPTKPLPPDPNAADGTLSRMRGTVQVDGAPAKQGDPLGHGNRVTTAAASGAEIVLRDETRVRLSESTELVVTAPKNAVKGSALGDEALAAGAARVKMGDPAGRRPLTIATENAHANVRGEAQVSVDASKVIRVAAYKNTSQITAHGKTVDVRESFGVKAEAGKAPGKPKLLPMAPAFGSPPPSVVFVSTQGGLASVSGSYGPGSGGDMPAEFHVQVARDEDFSDVLQDLHSPSSNTSLDVKDLAVGTYFIHVSAIDADKFEGPYSAPRKVTIGDIKITPKGKRRATVEVMPGGAYCGVAGGPLAPIAGEFEIDTVRATSVRCAPTPDGAITVRDVAAAKIGLRVLDAKVTHAEGSFEEGEVLIHLVDADNTPLEGVEVKSNAGADSTVGVFVSAGAGGAYKAPARWKKGASTLSFSVKVGDEESAAPPASLDAPPKGSDAPPPPDAKTAHAAIEIHADGGPMFVDSGLTQIGGRGRIGAGYGIVLGPGILAVGVDGSLEGYDRETYPGVTTSGASAGGIAVGKLHAFGVALPIQYRYGSYEKLVRPYIGITPEALFENASFSYLVGDHEASSVITSSATVLALTGLIGTEIKAGPGAIFAEVGYRGTQVVSRDPASVNLHGIVTGLGYRFDITY